MIQEVLNSKLSLRDERLDSLKFILILLVCFGHVFQINLSNYNEFSLAFYKLIYTIHVPLFAFLSGYFTNSDKNYRKSFVSLVGIIIWGNILWFICSGEKFTLGSFFTPQYHLWYIMALIWWRSVIHIISKKIDKKMILFLSFVASLAIAGLPSLGLLSIAITITFFPFFVLGNICRDSARFIDKWGGQNVLLGIVPFIIVFAVYYIFPMFGDIKHRGYEAGFLYQYVDRALFLIFATCLCFAFLVLYLKIKMPKVIASMGQNSLFYYFWHAYLRFICVYAYHCKWIELNMLTVWIMTLLILSVIYLCSKFRLAYILMNPLDRIRK